MIYISPIRLFKSKVDFKELHLEEILSRIDHESSDKIFSIDNLQIDSEGFKKIVCHCLESVENYQLHILVFEQKGMLRMLETYTFNPLAQVIAKGWNASTKVAIYDYFGPFLAFALNEFCEDELEQGKLNTVLMCTEHWESLTNDLSIKAQQSTFNYFTQIANKFKEQNNTSSHLIHFQKELGSFNFYKLINLLQIKESELLRNNIAEYITLESKTLIGSENKILSSVLLNAKSLNCSEKLHQEITSLYNQIDVGNSKNNTFNKSPNDKSGLKIGIVISVILLLVKISLFSVKCSSNRSSDKQNNMRLQHKFDKETEELIEQLIKEDKKKRLNQK